MPRLSDERAQDAKLKLLLIGDSKAGKTPWSGLAAETHNVLYLDGDVGLQSLNKLPAEIKPRLFHMPVADYVDENGVYVSRFADFFKSFTTEGKFLWNDTQGKPFERKSYVQTLDEDGQPNGGDEVWEIRPARMDGTCVLIMDSWTALAQSVMQWKADDLNTDLGDVEKIQREIYSGVGNKLTQFLTMIRGMPCHVIVIAHPDEYVKMEKPLGKIGSMKETEMKIQWTKMVPKSSSKPHALTMAKYFSDVGWLDIAPNGETKLDFKQATDRVIGGHLDEKFEAKKTKVAEVIRAVGGHVPPDPNNIPYDSWLTIFPNGTFVPAGAKPAAALGAAKPNPAPAGTTAPAPTLKVGGGLAGLMQKRQSGVEPGMSSK